jgi:RHS repeat-associated protein
MGSKVFSGGLAGKNEYLYNGKELQEDLLVGSVSLGYLDYGARMYDQSIGRWMVLDPSCEKYESNSSYSYVSNNPIMYTDPDGRDQEINGIPSDPNDYMNMDEVDLGGGGKEYEGSMTLDETPINGEGNQVADPPGEGNSLSGDYSFMTTVTSGDGLSFSVTYAQGQEQPRMDPIDPVTPIAPKQTKTHIEYQTVTTSVPKYEYIHNSETGQDDETFVGYEVVTSLIGVEVADPISGNGLTTPVSPDDFNLLEVGDNYITNVPFSVNLIHAGNKGGSAFLLYLVNYGIGINKYRNNDMTQPKMDEETVKFGLAQAWIAGQRAVRDMLVKNQIKLNTSPKKAL